MSTVLDRHNDCLFQIATLFESCTCHVVPPAQLVCKPAALCVEDETVDSSERFCCEELDLVLNLIHIVARVCRSRHPSSCTRSSLRPSPCLGCDPSRTRIFAVFAAASLPCQFLPAVGYALLTSCRSALSRCGCYFLPAVCPLFLPAVGPLFFHLLWVCSFLSSVSTASAATPLTSTCLSTCSSLFHNCFARQLSVSVTSLATRDLATRHCFLALFSCGHHGAP